MKLVIVDYGSGNLRSVAKAFERVSAERGIGADVLVSADPQVVSAADRVVLPGVGAFGDCRRGVVAIEGLQEALEHFALRDARPFLGICVGMQLMATRGVEHGVHEGFDWIPGEICKIEPSDPALKVPHMGWNTLSIAKPHPVLDGLQAGDHAYFVHSYAMRLEGDDALIATTDYGGPVTAMVGRDNLVGTQFHPEKSQAFGLQLLGNFLEWAP